MGSKIVTAVSHCGEGQHKLLVQLGIRVRDAYFTARDSSGALLYLNPPVSQATFTAQVGAADTAQGNVMGRGTSATTNRNTDTTSLFTSLGKLKLYANLQWSGNEANLRASGFYLSTDPVPHGIPAIPVIKSIKNGELPNSAKILYAKENPLTKEKGKIENIVQMATTNAEASFATVLETSSMRKLVIPNLRRGVEVFIRIARKNTAGHSAWSVVHPFILQ